MVESLKEKIKSDALGRKILLYPYRHVIKPLRTLAVAVPVSAAVGVYCLAAAAVEKISHKQKNDGEEGS